MTKSDGRGNRLKEMGDKISHSCLNVNKSKLAFVLLGLEDRIAELEKQI